jgi:hypothetical protein
VVLVVPLIVPFMVLSTALCLLPTTLSYYSRNIFDCRSIRAIGIVGEQADLVFCSIPPVKSRVTHCSV